MKYTCYHCGKTDQGVTFTRTERPIFNSKNWDCSNLANINLAYHPACYQKAGAIAEKILFPTL